MNEEIDMYDDSDTWITDGGIESVEQVADGTGTPAESGAGNRRGVPGVDRDVLLEVIRRAPILHTLLGGSARASEIVETVDLSRSTVHRATHSLEEYGLLERVDDEYRLTNLGRLLFGEVTRFERQSSTAFALAPFLNTITLDGGGFPIEHFADATITRRQPRQPHVTIHRIIKLIEQSDRLHMLSTVISPVYVDVGYREMMDGMEIDAVFEPEVVDLMLSEYPEKAEQTIATGNFRVYAKAGLPCELFIFDSKMGMAAHDENGNAEVLIECEDPAAVRWAESLYEKHYSRADPIDGV